MILTRNNDRLIFGMKQEVSVKEMNSKVTVISNEIAAIVALPKRAIILYEHN